MTQGYQRVNKPVRLLGVGFRLKDQESESLQQLDFWS
jgi:DNA polymerase-4